MAEALGAAATIISIVGFSAQAFDGCVKGFVLLSTAQNLGRDAEILRSMLEWEQFRLEQWGEKVGLQDPAKADILMDWKLIETTLVHLRNLMADTEGLKRKYALELVEQAPTSEGKGDEIGSDTEEKLSKSRFKRLFGSSQSSTAAARVIQSKNNAPKKLWWAAIDKASFQRLIHDISHFVQRLHDSLTLNLQSQMSAQITTLLHAGTHHYANIHDLECLRELASQLRSPPPSYSESETATTSITEEIDRGLRNLLFYSIRRGEIDEVRALLDKGLDINSENHVGWSTLIVASEHNQYAIASLLLSLGADPMKGTIGFRTPLHFAAEEGHVDLVQLLLSQPSVSSNLNGRDHSGQTPLFKAADKGHTAVVELLLQQPTIQPDTASNDGFTPLLQALFNRHTSIIRHLLARPDVDPNKADTSYGQTPLWMGCTTTLEILQLLLHRADIDINTRSRRGETPLFQSVQHGSLTATQMLLDAGADVNLSNENGKTPVIIAVEKAKEEHLSLLLSHPRFTTTISINAQDSLGTSALHHASTTGATKIIRVLLSHNPSASTVLKDSSGRTALHLAALHGHKIAGKILIKAGADINAQDGKGNTPLALAAVEGCEAVVRWLLENGADAEVVDEDEETPLEKARDGRLDDIVGVFKELKP